MKRCHRCDSEPRKGFDWNILTVVHRAGDVNRKLSDPEPGEHDETYCFELCCMCYAEFLEFLNPVDVVRVSLVGDAEGEPA